MTKTCTKCGVEKPITEFYKDKRRKDGLRIQCKFCCNQQLKQWKVDNPLKIKQGQKRWVEKNKNKVRAKEKKRNLERHFGMSLEDYNDLFAEQQGCCAICGKHQSEEGRALTVDHNHKTDEVRALLCRVCNVGLGLFHSDEKGTEFLEKAVEYIRKYNG